MENTQKFSICEPDTHNHRRSEDLDGSGSEISLIKKETLRSLIQCDNKPMETEGNISPRLQKQKSKQIILSKVKFEENTPENHHEYEETQNSILTSKHKSKTKSDRVIEPLKQKSFKVLKFNDKNDVFEYKMKGENMTESRRKKLKTMSKSTKNNKRRRSKSQENKKNRSVQKGKVKNKEEKCCCQMI